jgi:hypothetical protein
MDGAPPRRTGGERLGRPKVSRDAGKSPTSAPKAAQTWGTIGAETWATRPSDEADEKVEES